MRKRGLLALILVIAMLMTTSCSLIVKDEEVDKQTVIIEVAGESISKGAVQEYTEYMLDYNEYMYSNYGMSYDRKDPENIAQAQEEAITSIIQSMVSQQKIAEYGFDVYTEEELAQIEATAAEDYELYRSTIEMFYFADTELTGDELEAAIQAEMTNMGYPGQEQLVEEGKMGLAQTKLQDEMAKDVTVTEEEIASEYEYRVSTAKSNYEYMPSYFAEDLDSGYEIYYTPAGWRYVKQILVEFAEEDQTAVTEATTALTAKQNELNAVQKSLDALGEEDDKTELTAQVETLTAEVAELQKALDKANKDAYSAILPTVAEVQGKIEAGEDFNALIETYNDDPGMTKDSIGYAVSADSINWVNEFRDASMALAAIGDVSAPVRSIYGVHFIRYESDIAEGEIGLENVHDAIQEELLTTKKETRVTEVMNQWVEEANAKVYKDRL